MHELVTYKRAQYPAFVDEIQREGREITSIFEYQSEDGAEALLSSSSVVVDVTQFIELKIGEQPFVPMFELLLLRMPSDVLFIADEEVAEKGKYLLRNTFSSFKNCEAGMEDNQDGDVMEKKTLVSLEDAEYEGVVNTLDNDLIGQGRFKDAFKEHSKSFRLFYALGNKGYSPFCSWVPLVSGRQKWPRFYVTPLHQMSRFRRSILGIIAARILSILS